MVEGHFDGGTRAGTTFALLKCLWTHYGRHCEPFSGQKCTKLQDFAYTIPKFSGAGISPDPTEASPLLGPSHQFPLGSPALPLFLFYEMTIAMMLMWAWHQIKRVFTMNQMSKTHICIHVLKRCVVVQLGESAIRTAVVPHICYSDYCLIDFALSWLVVSSHGNTSSLGRHYFVPISRRLLS